MGVAAMTSPPARWCDESDPCIAVIGTPSHSRRHTRFETGVGREMRRHASLNRNGLIGGVVWGRVRSRKSWRRRSL